MLHRNPSFVWRQHPDSIDVSVPVPSGTTTRDVHWTLSPHHVSLRLAHDGTAPSCDTHAQTHETHGAQWWCSRGRLLTASRQTSRHGPSTRNTMSSTSRSSKSIVCALTVFAHIM